MIENRKVTQLSLNDKDYIREYELLGDVEKVRWYELKKREVSIYSSIIPFDEIEVYDQESLDKLELEYEIICINEISPRLLII